MQDSLDGFSVTTGRCRDVMFLSSNVQPRGSRRNTRATGRKGSLKSKKRLVNNTSRSTVLALLCKDAVHLSDKRQFVLPQRQRLKPAGEEHKPGRRRRREPGPSRLSKSEREEETSHPPVPWRSPLTLRLIHPRFIKGYMERGQAKTTDNSEYLAFVRQSYLTRLKGHLPKTVLDKTSWLSPPAVLAEVQRTTDSKL